MIRWLVLLIAIPVIAFAKPKVAVAPLDGDDDNKVSDVVAEAAADHAKVTGPSKTAREMNDLGVTTLSGKSLKKLRGKLEVDVVIHGKLEKDGNKKRVALVLSGKGKTKATLDLEFKSTKTLKKELGKELGKKLEVATGEGNDDEPDDEDTPPAKNPFGGTSKDDDQDKEKARRKAEDDEKDKQKAKEQEQAKRKAEEDDKSKKRVAAAEEARKKSDEDDSDNRKRRKKRRGGDDDAEPERDPLTQGSLWLDAGANASRRSLTYDATGGTPPPPVGTADFAGKIEGEAYPASFSTMNGLPASLGVFVSYAQTLGLGIKVPGTTVTAPIDEAAYEIGARYRFRVGDSSSLAIGVGYWGRHYIADRTGLMTADKLDMPDTDYSAIAPGAIVRFPATPTVGAFAALEIPLLLASGPITSGAQLGRASAIAFDLRGGVQIPFATHYAVLLAAQFEQVGFSFAAPVRGITGATDRSIGLAATVGVYY